MEKVLALDHFWSPAFVKNRAKVLGKKETRDLRFFLAVILIALNVMLLMSYIYGVNKYTANGYDIKKLQTQLAGLTEENKKINLKISEAGSMVSIQSNFLNSNFVAAGTPKFLEVTQLTQR